MRNKKDVSKVLLIGNGINRAYGVLSWDDLISSIQTKTLTQEEKACLCKIPYPLQPVVLTEDNVGDKMREIAGPLCGFQSSEEEAILIQKFASLPVDAILTTNYTYEIETALCSDFTCKVGRSSKFRKKAYTSAGKYETNQLHTYLSVDKDKPCIWHVHGEAAKPDTMVIGHYYYGKLLAKIQQYVSKLLARYSSCHSQGREFEWHSWVDYFLLSDVYIVGLGLDLSEMDLWWLINCKKRHFKDLKMVLYKTDIKKEEELLAEAYGVEVESGGLNGTDYVGYYKWVCDDIRKRCGYEF